MPRTAGVLALLLGAASCGDPGPSIRLQAFGIADGATALGYTGAALLVMIDTQGSPRPQAELDAGVTRVSLRTWPEGQLVANTTENIGGGTPGVSTFALLTALEPLDDRWYWLDLGRVQRPYVPTQIIDGQRTGVRFRMGSHPAVRLIEMCAGPSTTEMIVKFSEAVYRDQSGMAAARVSRDGADLACTLSTSSLTEFHFTCPPNLGQVTVTVSGGLVAPTGVDVMGGAWTFDARGLKPAEQCPGYRVPQPDL